MDASTEQKYEVFVKAAFKKIIAVYPWQKSKLFVVFDELENLSFNFNRISPNIIETSLSLYLLYYAEARNQLARPSSALLLLGNAASFEGISQQWRAVGNIASN